MAKQIPTTTHPIIENIILTFFSIFVLIGGILSISRGIAVEAMVEAGVEGVEAASKEASMWFGFGFFGYSGLYGYETFLWRKDKKNFIFSLACCLAFLALGLLCVILRGNGLLVVIAAMVFFGMLALRRLAIAFSERTKRSIILNALMLIFLVTAIISCIPCFKVPFLVLALVGVFWLVLSLWFICFSAFKRMRIKVLAKIVQKTYAAEIFIGMLSMIVAFSIAFFYLEDGFNTIGDALWYSFAVVTTIGFGDFTVTSIVSRILSVILGLYGLIVVAVITSIIVNFYNETKGGSEEKAVDAFLSQEKEEDKDKNKEENTKEEE